jgi:ketosteroid isomerase-like protein
VIAGEGDTVVAANDLEMVVKATGKTIVDVEVHIWTFNPDGSVRSMRHVVDTLLHARALEP